MSGTTTEIYDLIIVGGGPAGATAALYAHRRGLKTLLLDKCRFPRDKVCGDALSGKAISVLHELELLEQVRQLPGALIRTVVFGSPDHTHAHIPLDRYHHQDLLTGKALPMEGMVVRREVFDHFLFEQARKSAAGCAEDFAVRELICEEGRVCGVRGERGEDGVELEFRGSLVLGCDGFNSVVARRTGLYANDPRHGIVALRCYYEGVADLQDQIELHFLDQVLPGYFWIFPMEDGRANVGIGMLHADLRRRGVDLRQALQQVITHPPFASRFAGARPLEQPRGWNLPVGSKHRHNHGDGFLLLGDAAGLIDPFTGEGIGNALYSSRLAVDTAVEALQAGDLSAGFLRRYDRRLWATLGPELAVSSRLQRLGRWRALLNLVVGKAATDTRIGDLVCAMIANAVPKSRLTNPLFYLRLLLG